MAINFPGTPSNGDTFTQGTTTWQYNGTGWAIKDSTVSNTVFKTFLADTGTTTADAVNDSFTLEGGTDISTAITGDKVVIAYTGSGSGGCYIRSRRPGRPEGVRLESWRPALLCHRGDLRAGRARPPVDARTREGVAVPLADGRPLRRLPRLRRAHGTRDAQG